MTSRSFVRTDCCVLYAAAVLVCAAAQAQSPQIEFVQQGLDEARYSFNASLNVPAPGDVRLDVVFDYRDPQNHHGLVLAGGTAQFRVVRDGNVSDLGLPGKAALTPGDHTITIQRRPWRMACIFDNVVIAAAYDASLGGGDVGYSASGVTVKEPFVQPISATLTETDDFMRTGKEGNPWHAVSGSWEYKRLRVEAPQKQDDTRAANAFSYFGRDEGVALAVYGLPNAQGYYPYWFWDDYSFSCAVRSEGAAVGAVVFYQGPNDYLVFRWTSLFDEGGGKKQFVAVANGQQEVLAEKPGGFLPHQWYAMRVQTSDGLVECFIDDELQLAVRTNRLGQGQVGLYVEGQEGASFDDVRVERYVVVADRVDRDVPGQWRARAGKWQWDKRGYMVSSGKQSAILTTGAPEWSNYIFAATVKPENAAAAGLVFYDTDEGRYVFRCARSGSRLDYAGQAQLIKQVGDQETVLDAAKVNVPRNKWHRLKVSCVEGHLIAFLDGQPVLEQVDFDLSSGGMGLYADGSGASLFDDVYLRFYREKPPVEISPQFQSPGDNSMVEWATKQGQWLPPKEKGQPYWYKGEFFGDSRVRFKLPSVGKTDGSVTITLAQDQSKPDAGYQIVLATVKGQPVVNCKLLVGGAAIQEGQAKAEGKSSVDVRIERRGTFLLTFIDDQCVLKYRMRAAPAAAKGPGGVG
ncbi:MAG: family 16 glycoside hydrolase [Armatimonadota bacterium]